MKPEAAAPQTTEATGELPTGATVSDSPASGSHTSRQPIAYCPYCSEETLFPIDNGGWECRSCLRAFSVRFIGLAPAAGAVATPRGGE